MTAQTSAGHTPEPAYASDDVSRFGSPQVSTRKMELRKGLEIGFTKTNRHKKVPPSSTSTLHMDITEGNGILKEENKSHRCKSNYLSLSPGEL